MTPVRLFLCGDVMLGRGIDQILLHPGDPVLYERHVRSAATYVALAEHRAGPIPRGVESTYVWGEALPELARIGPDLRIINLETSITRSTNFVPKGINYRMNPQNISCLSAARIDCCVLANNHVLDWNTAGLSETLTTLEQAGIATAGAGRDAARASAPAILKTPPGPRVLIFAFGTQSSGIPADWGAGDGTPGVNLLLDLSEQTIARVAAHVKAVSRPGDIVIASIHWGGNWAYPIPAAHRAFAHGLIDVAGVHLVHGHSSHHAKAIEIYRDKLILYGCGDFITDYEGISGYEAFRGDLALMYLPVLSAETGRLVNMRMVPFQPRKFRLCRASQEDTAWLKHTLDTESTTFGTHVLLNDDGSLALSW